MPSFKMRHTMTKTQRNERTKRSRNRPGGKTQKPGTQPRQHLLPDKPVFKPIEAPESVQRKVDLAVAAEMAKKKSAPDVRCPKCDSSRMQKEGLKTCPECGYGNPYHCSKCDRMHKSGKVYDEHWEHKVMN